MHAVILTSRGDSCSVKNGAMPANPFTGEIKIDPETGEAGNLFVCCHIRRVDEEEAVAPATPLPSLAL